jgi:ubiquinone/menaquinone biosynthesis C-methylase UbiE
MKKCGTWRFLAGAFILVWAALAAAQSLENDERRANERQPPDKVMDAIGLRPGMVIGEVGAGQGRYTVHLSQRVGPAGKVYANDIARGGLDYLEERCRKNGIKNVEIILGEVADPLFPKGALDMAFMILTYHHLARPVELLRNLAPSLKPDATVAIVDADPVRSGNTDPNESISLERMKREAGEAGYEVIRVETFLRSDNIFILRLKPAR